MTDAALLIQAFLAGVVAFFSPCGIAMLPAYVGYYLATGREAADVRDAGASWNARTVGAAASIGGALLLGAGLYDLYLSQTTGAGGLTLRQVGAILAGAGALLVGLLITRVSPGVRRAALFAASASAGLIAVFLLLGLPIALFAGSLLRSGGIAAVDVVVGLLLVGLGVAMLLGFEPGRAMPVRAPKERGIFGFALFGAAYGLVSLGCTFPVFGIVVVGALVQGSLIGGLAGFAAYGLGLATLVTALTVSLAASRGLTPERVRAALPHARKASAIVLILAGAYVAWYGYVFWTTGLPP